MELKKKQVECQNIQMKLDNLQKKNSQYEKDYNTLRLQVVYKLKNLKKKKII
jgi:hypothetical protein